MDRKKKILQLRKEGKTYKEIGDLFGVSRQTIWQSIHREIINERMHNWHKEYMRKWRKENSEKVNRYNKNWRAKNIERFRKEQREYMAKPENRMKKRVQDKEWREKNKERKSVKEESKVLKSITKREMPKVRSL